MHSDSKRKGSRWKMPATSRAALQRILYVVASLAALAMAVGAGWKPMAR